MTTFKDFKYLQRISSTLKILSFLYRGVPVQVRPEAPFLYMIKQLAIKTSRMARLLSCLKRSHLEGFVALSDSTMTALRGGDV